MKLSPAQVRLLRLVSGGPRQMNGPEWASVGVLQRLGYVEMSSPGHRRITEAGRAALKDL